MNGKDRRWGARYDARLYVMVHVVYRTEEKIMRVGTPWTRELWGQLEKAIEDVPAGVHPPAPRS